MSVVAHVAIWTRDLERLRDFYVRFFGARAGPLYHSRRRPFESCFLSFEEGARLELMRLPELAPAAGPDPRVGLAHVAVSVASRERVDALTAELQGQGFTVLSPPRTTGDGYYESVALDPDGNVVEIAA